MSNGTQPLLGRDWDGWPHIRNLLIQDRGPCRIIYYRRIKPKGARGFMPLTIRSANLSIPFVNWPWIEDRFISCFICFGVHNPSHQIGESTPPDITRCWGTFSKNFRCLEEKTCKFACKARYMRLPACSASRAPVPGPVDPGC